MSATAELNSGLEQLRALIALFDPIADQANARPICWISGAGDAGTDYCSECARRKAKHLRRHYKDCGSAAEDGGWDDFRESDGTSFCGGCGHLLGYSLSHYGFGEELAYWSEDDWSENVTPVHAYQIRAVLDAACVYREMVQEAVSIGERAAALLAKAPSPAPETRDDTRDGGVS